MIWLDDYERRARLVPGLWLLAPVIIAGVILGLDDYPVVSLAAGGVSAFGGPVLLAGYVRQRGLAFEDKLIVGWGGWPTTQLLRTGPTQLVDHRRTTVQRVTGIQLPPKDQADNPGYDVAISSVRAKTRDRARYELLFAENRNYGFERNLLGVRPIGLWISALMFIIVGVLFLTWLVRYTTFRPEFLLGWLVIAMLWIGWWTVPSEERAKTAGFKYAERLLEACETL